MLESIWILLIKLNSCRTFFYIDFVSLTHSKINDLSFMSWIPAIKKMFHYFIHALKICIIDKLPLSFGCFLLLYPLNMAWTLLINPTRAYDIIDVITCKKINNSVILDTEENAKKNVACYHQVVIATLNYLVTTRLFVKSFRLLKTTKRNV